MLISYSVVYLMGGREFGNRKHVSSLIFKIDRLQPRFDTSDYLFFYMMGNCSLPVGSPL